MIQIPQLNNSKKKALLFIVKLVSLFLILHGFYTFIIEEYTQLDQVLINLLIDQSEFMLSQLGYELLSPNPLYTNHFGIADSSGVVIGDPCDGISLFILFLSFILVFKGHWKTTFLFIVLGIISIHLLNSIRVTSLALIVVYYPDSLDFHHSYTFTLLVYAFIFFLWIKRIEFFKKTGK